ncbi:MAG: SRPBCC domain-containing protein [Candidatus Aenigmarchaeota archaeon]|nr:SRPBCC domain-containing protein [Candidatus Aenigmarchaeota archaeon]
MKTIRQSIIFNASSHEIFEMLMDSEKHSFFTDDKASISRKVGGKISAYGGYIEGKNLEIIPDKKMVQEWRAIDWDDGIWSIITFEFKASGRGCKLIFTQEGVPDNQFKEISKGWKEHYWDRMKKVLESRQ